MGAPDVANKADLGTPLNHRKKFLRRRKPQFSVTAEEGAELEEPGFVMGPTKKRQRAEAVDLTAEGDATEKSAPKKRRTKAPKKDKPEAAGDVIVSDTKASENESGKAIAKKGRKPSEDGEKRMRRYRDKPPQSYDEILNRVMTQRMFVIDRTRSTPPSPPSETLSIAGTTGNIYTVTIAHVPSCTCPHALKGAQCKHILYALVRVLKAPPTLQYQLAFLTSELDTIFDSAPPLPAADASAADSDGKRKPLDDDCPICCCPFEPESEEIVFCRAACGNNIHGACFAQWAASKKGSAVTCPFCRTPWQGDEKTLKQVSKSGRVNAEGYVNVAGQLGLSGRRDYSTYHSHWVARQRRAGLVDDADGDEY